MSATPRTDSFISGVQADDSVQFCESVWRRASRQLETELAQAKQKLCEMAERCSFSTGHAESLNDVIAEIEWQVKEEKVERDKWREVAGELAKCCEDNLCDYCSDTESPIMKELKKYKGMKQ